jgi:hypothetical protein
MRKLCCGFDRFKDGEMIKGERETERAREGARHGTNLIATAKDLVPTMAFCKEASAIVSTDL